MKVTTQEDHKERKKGLKDFSFSVQAKQEGVAKKVARLLCNPFRLKKIPS